MIGLTPTQSELVEDLITDPSVLSYLTTRLGWDPELVMTELTGLATNIASDRQAAA